MPGHRGQREGCVKVVGDEQIYWRHISGVDNIDGAPAVPLPCTGIRLVQRSCLLRIMFELCKESSGILSIIRLCRPIPRSRGLLRLSH